MTYRNQIHYLKNSGWKWARSKVVCLPQRGPSNTYCGPSKKTRRKRVAKNGKGRN